MPNSNPTRDVIAKQDPSAGNNYTWYRLYSDGWVEQGGIVPTPSSSGTITVNLVIKMADIGYAWSLGYGYNSDNQCDWKNVSIWNRTTTTFFMRTSINVKKCWQVSGMSNRGSTQQNRKIIKY